MKHIAFFIASISGSGGTERACCEIANHLSGRRYKVTIVSMYGDQSFFTLDDAIDVRAVWPQKQNTKLAVPVSLLKVRNILKAVRPDILISVDAALFSYAWLAALFQGITHIVWEHFHFHASLDAGIRVISRKLAAKYSAAVVALTNRDVISWKMNLHCRCRMLSIPNPSPFSSVTFDDAARKPVVLSVGRLTAQKGFDRLLEGWAKITATMDKPWELHIVGSGELKELLEEMVASLQLTTVKLIKTTSAIEQHYKEASIYCMTSRFEGFPMVLIEAQSFGLPVITYDCPTGPAEIVNSRNGILVPDGDEDALLRSLRSLMADHPKRMVLGKNALQDSAKYHINNVIKQWIALLDRL